MTKPKIAIIGAGLSGVTCAHHLKEYTDITLFEKSRGIGGRMSTRYADPYQFDHGAQYFTARKPAFKAFLKPFIETGTVQEWIPKTVTLEAGKKPYKREWFEPHYVASPRMNMLCKTIAAALDVNIKIEIASLEKTAEGWHLHDKEGQAHGPFDWVISSAPSHQATNLLNETFNGYEHIKNIQMLGCYSLMLGFETQDIKDWPLNFGAAIVKNSPIGWIAVNSDKPNRETGISLMIQSTNDWAESHIEDDQENVKNTLMHEVDQLLGIESSTAAYQSLHRWRYADTANPLEQPYLIDPSQSLATCGDWHIGGRVEAAFTSGYELAQHLRKII